MGAADKVSCVYTMSRTHLVTGMAIITLGVIDGCDVFYQGNCTVRAGFHTFAAGYTAIFAYLANFSALVVVVTLYDYR